MSERKLRAAVIGGGLGAYHGYAYQKSPAYDLVAICDLNLAVMDRFYERSQIERGTLREYTDYNEMFAKENLDVVSVATPDDFHVHPVCDASNAGIKGILCEKPLTTNLADGDLMLATLARNGTKFAVDHTRSWIPSYQAVRQAIRDGEIGGLTRIVAHMGGRRSMLFRNGTHLVDAVCFFADAEPVWVIAAHERGFEEYGTVYKGQGGKDPQFDPASTIIVEFANGVRALINSAKMTPAIFEFDLLGPNGRFWLTDAHCTAWKTDKPEGKPVQVAAPEARGFIDYFGENLVPAVEEMAAMVWHDGPNSSPARRALNTLEIMVAALHSQAQGCAKIQLPMPRD